ncbi:hypothetical protein CLU83_3871 [Flavobacterium sp. 1]|uniref:hypothetical protein n=1 Tax=Flavobacterium sp. 1 TaxID=2035200 RepID=UPI000C24F6B0|nr:hypothetical protein [Flavobacterium sp. 1]PJJ10449.1 hypothetical protein CLU83_3871 [Flavobacterium sp. 1]
MKKAILTIGLFALVLVSTSFASPNNSTTSVTDNTVITSIDGNGGQSTGDNRKVDYNGGSFKNQIVEIDGNGGQSTGDNRKVD